MGGSRQEILHWQQDMNRREFKERMAFLRGHLAKFRAERTELAKACVAAGGHDWTSTPNNELIPTAQTTDLFCTGIWPVVLEDSVAENGHRTGQLVLQVVELL